MSFLANFLIAFIYLSLLNGNETTQDFCQSFATNSHQIDYSFQYMKTNDNNTIGTELVLFIGQNYWFIEIIGKTVSLHKTGLKSDWFGSEYTTAFSTEFSPGFIYGLYKPDDQNIHWGQFRGTGLTGTHQTEASTYFSFKSDFKPTVSVRVSYKSIVCFMSQKPNPNDTTVFVRNYRCYDLTDIHIPIHVSHNIETIYSVHFESNSPYQLVTVSGPYTQHQYLWLYKVDNSLFYCWTDKDRLFTDCPKSDHKLLINCKLKSEPSALIPESAGFGSGAGDGSSPIYTICYIIMVLAFVLTVSVIVMSFLVYNKQQEVGAQPLAPSSAKETKDKHKEEAKDKIKDEGKDKATDKAVKNKK